MDSTNVQLDVAQTAAESGISAHALRYYEREGLMRNPIARDQSGHRRYSAEDLRWIVMLTRLRHTGMPIREVKRYAELVRSGPGNEAQRLSLLQTHHQRVLTQLEQTQEHLAAIEHKIEIYDQCLAEAPLNQETNDND